MRFPTLQTWFGKKASAAIPSPPKDRSGVRVGIPKVLNMWSTHQFWVAFLREIGIASENIVFSSDTSEEQGRDFAQKSHPELVGVPDVQHLGNSDADSGPVLRRRRRLAAEAFFANQVCNVGKGIFCSSRFRP